MEFLEKNLNPLVPLINLTVQRAEIIKPTDPKNPARHQPNQAAKNFSEIKSMNSEQP
jgi:hypothetical protein